MKPSKHTIFGVAPNVFALGLVSFFNDVASEMIYPLIPLFLTSVLGAPATVVGLIEGIAESTASLLKVVSGWLSDRFQSRKPFTVAGYGFSSLSKLLLGLAYAWPLVLVARFVDRFGKGVRTSARDALITESSAPEERGRSFGFHRALDSAGAVVGPLLALVAIDAFGENYRQVFFLAFIPALIGVLLLVIFVKEKRATAKKTAPFHFHWADLDASFRLFLFISFIFALGNSSDAFIILRAQDLGLSLTSVILVYVLFNIVYTLASTPAGIISDRLGPRVVLISGFIIFAAVYLFFGLAADGALLWLLFPIYGLYMALTDGVGKAYISNLVPSEKSGTAFGVYQTVIGLCTFLASLFAGLLWTYVGVSAPFIFGSIMALLASLLFFALGRRPKAASTR